MSWFLEDLQVFEVDCLPDECGLLSLPDDLLKPHAVDSRVSSLDYCPQLVHIDLLVAQVPDDLNDCFSDLLD
jgi:hypothetical protein